MARVRRSTRPRGRCCCWRRPNGWAIRRSFGAPRTSSAGCRGTRPSRTRRRAGSSPSPRRSSSAIRSSDPPSTTPRRRPIVGAPTLRSPRRSMLTSTPIDGVAPRRRRAEPDEHIARSLEASAERARQRGGASAAAFLLWRAAELTPDRERATERLLEAARAELVGGRGSRAQDILDQARASGLGEQHRADAAWTEALIHIVAGDVRQAAALMPDALPSIDAGQPELAAGACVAAIAAALTGGHLIQRADSPCDRRRSGGRRRPLRYPRAHRAAGGRLCGAAARRAAGRPRDAPPGRGRRGRGPNASAGGRRPRMSTLSTSTPRSPRRAPR